MIDQREGGGRGNFSKELVCDLDDSLCLRFVGS